MQTFDVGNLFEASHLEAKWGMEDSQKCILNKQGFGDIAASIDTLLDLKV